MIRRESTNITNSTTIDFRREASRNSVSGPQEGCESFVFSSETRSNNVLQGWLFLFLAENGQVNSFHVILPDRGGKARRFACVAARVSLVSSDVGVTAFRLLINRK